EIEGRIGRLRQRRGFANRAEYIGRNPAFQCRIADPVAWDFAFERRAAAGTRRQKPSSPEIEATVKIGAHPDRPSDRANVESERTFDLVEKFERIPPLAIDLVYERDDRNVAKSANLEKLAGL